MYRSISTLVRIVATVFAPVTAAGLAARGCHCRGSVCACCVDHHGDDDAAGGECECCRKDLDPKEPERAPAPARTGGPDVLLVWLTHPVAIGVRESAWARVRPARSRSAIAPKARRQAALCVWLT